MANGSECIQLGLFQPDQEAVLHALPLQLVMCRAAGVVLNIAKGKVVGVNDGFNHITFVGKTKYLGRTVELLGLL